MSLIKILGRADAINIDDCFIRYFELENTNDLDPDTIMLDISIEADGNVYDYVFTRANLEAGKQNDAGDWEVPSSDDMNLGATITPCAVRVLKYAP